MSDALTLKAGQRLRTAGTTYEVKTAAEVPAGLVPVAPQATRLLKVACGTCGYTCRITKRWIDKAGTPICPTCSESMIAEVKTAAARVDVSGVTADPPFPSAPEYVPADSDLESYDVETRETTDESTDDSSELAKLISEL